MQIYKYCNIFQDIEFYTFATLHIPPAYIRPYILSVCSLFINLKATSKLTSFQTGVFRVEGFSERLKASQFSLFNVALSLQAAGFDVSLSCILMLHF